MTLELQIFLTSVMTVILAGGVGYGFYKLIVPRSVATTPGTFGRRWMAWTVWITTISLMPKFFRKLDEDSLVTWLICVVFYGGVAFLLGWVCGLIKFRRKKPSNVPTQMAAVEKFEVAEKVAEVTVPESPPTIVSIPLPVPSPESALLGGPARMSSSSRIEQERTLEGVGTSIWSLVGFRIAVALVCLGIAIAGIAAFSSREESSTKSQYALPAQTNYALPIQTIAHVETGSLAAIQLFDGSLSVMPDGRGTNYTNEIGGRVRNSLEKPIDRVKVYIELKSASGETIETIRFDINTIDSRAPLMPGDVRGWTHKGWWERLPRDMKWAWAIIEADYSSP